jgi:formamidopyrimidine-DNA glycosylase
LRPQNNRGQTTVYHRKTEVCPLCAQLIDPDGTGSILESSK